MMKLLKVLFGNGVKDQMRENAALNRKLGASVMASSILKRMHPLVDEAYGHDALLLKRVVEIIAEEVKHVQEASL